MAGLYDGAARALGVSGEPVADTGFRADDAINALTSGGTNDPKYVPDSVEQPVQQPQPEKSILQRIGGVVANKIGDVEAAVSLGTGAAGSAAGAVTGLARGLLPSNYGKPEGAAEAALRAREVADTLTYRPRTAEGQERVESISRAIDASKLAGLGPVEGTSLAGVMAGPGRIPRPAAAPAARVAPVAPVAEAGVRGQMASVGAAGVAPLEQARGLVAGASPTLKAAVEDAGKKGAVNLEALNRHLDAESLPVPVRLSKGQATGDPVFISNEQNRRAKEGGQDARNFNEQNKALIENTDAIRDSAAPDVFVRSKPEQGQTFIDSYREIDRAKRKEISANYKALNDANGGQFPLDGATFVANSDAALASKMKGRYLPAEIRGDLDQIKKTGNMTFEEFENMRTTIASEVRKAERAGDGNRSYALGLVRDELEKFPMPAGAENMKQLADKARLSAKERFDLLRSDPAYAAAINDTVKPGDFVHRFVIDPATKDPAKLKAMVSNLGEGSLAHQTMAAGLIDELKSQAVGTTGNFSQSRYNTLLNKVRPGLASIVPQKEASQIEKLGRVAGYTQEQPRGSFVNNSNSTVAMIGEHAKDVTEKAVNFQFAGVPVGTWARKIGGRYMEQRDINQSWQPGAGIKLKDVGK